MYTFEHTRFVDAGPPSVAITHPREERLIAVWFCRKFMVDKSAAKGGTRLPKTCANDVIRPTATTGKDTLHSVKTILYIYNIYGENKRNTRKTRECVKSRSIYRGENYNNYCYKRLVMDHCSGVVFTVCVVNTYIYIYIKVISYISLYVKWLAG